jgi:hypothetical protein
MSASNLEYCLLYYVPSVVNDSRVSIAAIFVDPTDLKKGLCTMSFAENWQTNVRLLDPDADLEMLTALLTELKDRLCNGERSQLILQLEGSFSNVVQISPKLKCPVAPTLDAIEAFSHELWESKETSRGSGTQPAGM